MGDQNVSALLRQSALRWPSAPALAEGDRLLSYGELDRLVSEVAAGLARRGVAPGDHVGIFATNSLEHAVAHIAIDRCGAVAVLYSFRATAEELKPQLALTHPRLVIFDAEQADVASASALAAPGIEWFCIGDRAASFAHPWSDLVAVSERYEAVRGDDEPGMMMFTSGTTGLSKAVVLDRRSEWINALLMIAELDIRPGDRTLHIAPLFHIAAWDVMLVPHLAVGGLNVIQRRFDPAQMAALIDRHAITNLLGVPTHFEICQREALAHSPQLASLRRAFLTGAPVRRPTVEWIQETICRDLANVYGMTETMTLITVCPPAEMHRYQSTPCIGRALLGMEVRVVATDSDAPPEALVEPGTLGQLICRGPKLLREYYRNAEQTARRLRGGWLYTGDVCFADGDGYFYLSDRIDDLIITGAEKVYPIEIERVLNDHPGVTDSVVMGVPDAQWGQRVKAFVVRSNQQLTAEELLGWVASNGGLSGYKRPREIEFIAEIPRNPSGKVLKRALRR